MTDYRAEAQRVLAEIKVRSDYGDILLAVMHAITDELDEQDGFLVLEDLAVDTTDIDKRVGRYCESRGVTWLDDYDICYSGVAIIRMEEYDD